MTLSPQDLQRIMAEGAEQDAEDITGAIQQTIEDGWLIWPTATPSMELKAFKAWTIPADLALVTTDGYLDLFKAGLLPPLQCMILQQQAEAAGMPYEPDFFWAQLATKLPPFVFEHYQRRFISLVKAELKAAA